jgi:hypothetical protein
MMAGAAQLRCTSPRWLLVRVCVLTTLISSLVTNGAPSSLPACLVCVLTAIAIAAQ